MIEIAKAMTDEDNRAASEYFASLKPHSRQKVVESATAPKSFVGGGGMRYASAEGGTEPIGSRIILIPDTAEGAQRRNPKSNFVAYVPEGSIAQRQGARGRRRRQDHRLRHLPRTGTQGPRRGPRHRRPAIRSTRSGSSTTCSRAAAKATPWR